MVGAGKKRMAWRDVRQVRLDYYSTRRDGQGGWMQMKISGPGGHIRIDSALDGFARLAGEPRPRGGARDSHDRDHAGQFPGDGCRAPPPEGRRRRVNGDLLTVTDLRVSFDLPEGVIEAVRGVSFSVKPGSTVALVGESGSGKTVVSQAIMGILPKVGPHNRRLDPVRRPGQQGRRRRYRRPASQQPRHARYQGRAHIDHFPGADDLAVAAAYGRQTRFGGPAPAPQMLGPKAASWPGNAAYGRLSRPGRALRTYPFELSGGLRQRAMIAMALICQPALLIADEPTTALDVTIQAQILKQIIDLQAELGMAVLIITHDLGIVANVAEEVVVMYHGESHGIAAAWRISSAIRSIPI